MQTAALSLYPLFEESKLPRWEARHRRLWLGEMLLKQFAREAPAQEMLLATFEAQGWPDTVDNPFTGDAGITAQECLENAVKGLNRRHLVIVIRFGLIADRSGAKWRFVPPS